MTSRRATVRGIGLAAALAVLGGLAAPVAVALPGEGRPVALEAKAGAGQGKGKGKGKRPVAKDDFNGDGYRDVAASAGDSAVNGKADAGKVAVVYGSRKGPGGARKQMIHQNTPGIVGTAEQQDFFGRSLASADLDRDGYTDLVVGAFGEEAGKPDLTKEPTGSLTVIWGGKQGLKGSAILLRGQAHGDFLGLDVTTGDIDGDGDTDVVATSRKKDLKVLSGPFKRSGKATGKTVVLRQDHIVSDLATGYVDGDDKADLVSTSDHVRFWRGTSKGLAPGAGLVGPKGKRVVGDVVDLGDVNGDGYEDLVVGDPYDYIGPVEAGSAVTYVPGSGKGPDPARAQTVERETLDVPSPSPQGPGFGTGVSVGDVNGDGYAEVAVGHTSDMGEQYTRTGAVFILRGSGAGPKTTGVQRITQETPGVPGASGRHPDDFGAAVRLIDADRDRKADLYVSARYKNTAAGELWFLKGGHSGITGEGSVSFGASAFGDAPGSTVLLGDSFGD